MDYAPLWFPFLVGLASLVIVSILQSGSKIIGPVFKDFWEEPFRCLWSLPGKIFFLWIAGAGFINFALGLWIIHVRLKSDLLGWLLS